MAVPQFRAEEVDGITLVSLAGDLEGHGADEFRELMDRLLRGPGAPRVVLDVSAVQRMSSYLVALVGFYSSQFCQARGRLVLAGAGAPARRAFELSGLAATVVFADTVEQALGEARP